MENEQQIVLELKENIPFTQVCNSVLDSKYITFKAKGLYAYLCSKATIQGWKFYRKHLHKASKDGRESVDSAIKELKDLGVLEIVQIKDKDTGRILNWKWTIKAMLISRNLEKPYYGKTVLRETRTYNNTESSNTGNNNTEKELAPKKKALPSQDVNKVDNADSRIPKVWDWYIAFYEKLFKVKPTIAFGKVGSLVKARLKALDSEGYEPEAALNELRRIVSTVISNAAKGVARYPFDGKTSLEMVLAGNVWDAARRELGQGRRTAVVPEATKAINPNIGCLEGRELQGKRIEETLSLQTEE